MIWIKKYVLENLQKARCARIAKWDDRDAKASHHAPKVPPCRLKYLGNGRTTAAEHLRQHVVYLGPCIEPGTGTSALPLHPCLERLDSSTLGIMHWKPIKSSLIRLCSTLDQSSVQRKLHSDFVGGNRSSRREKNNVRQEGMTKGVLRSKDSPDYCTALPSSAQISTRASFVVVGDVSCYRATWTPNRISRISDRREQRTPTVLLK